MLLPTVCYSDMLLLTVTYSELCELVTVSYVTYSYSELQWVMLLLTGLMEAHPSEVLVANMVLVLFQE